jgi:hypothetical protein
MGARRRARAAASARAALVLVVIAVVGGGLPANASPRTVTIVQQLTGDFCTGAETGETFASTGAVEDGGSVTGSELQGAIHRRVLVGAEGTITASFVFTSLDVTDTGFTATERWWITSGTGAYVNLRASGTGGGWATFSGDADCPHVTGTDVWRGVVAT